MATHVIHSPTVPPSPAPEEDDAAMTSSMMDVDDNNKMMMQDNNNNSNDDNEILMSLADDGDGECCNGLMCQTVEECEEDRKLLEAFLNETDIDLIENNNFNDDYPDAAARVNGGEHNNNNNSLLQNIRQVSDGTFKSPSPPPHIVLPASPTPPPPPTTTTTTTTTTNTAIITNTKLTGRPPIQLYLSCNPDHLSAYQCLIRKNIELFEATEPDVNSRIKGRNKPIVLGQVGIRCIFCKHIYNPENRGRGSMYYPKKLTGIYQAAQILSQGHFLQPNICGFIPQDVQIELQKLKQLRENHQNGKDYWAATAKALGVYEDEYGLRFESRLGLIQHH